MQPYLDHDLWNARHARARYLGNLQEPSIGFFGVRSVFFQPRHNDRGESPHSRGRSFY